MINFPRIKINSPSQLLARLLQEKSGIATTNTILGFGMLSPVLSGIQGQLQKQTASGKTGYRHYKVASMFVSEYRLHIKEYIFAESSVGQKISDYMGRSTGSTGLPTFIGGGMGGRTSGKKFGKIVEKVKVRSAGGAEAARAQFGKGSGIRAACHGLAPGVEGIGSGISGGGAVLVQ